MILKAMGIPGGLGWLVGWFFFIVLGLCRCTRFSLVTVSGGYSVVAVRQLLIAVASLVAEYKF